jgi:hypothetical protein
MKPAFAGNVANVSILIIAANAWIPNYTANSGASASSGSCPATGAKAMSILDRWENLLLISAKKWAELNQVSSAHVLIGSPARTRTTDMVVNSHPLYRLSYWGKVVSCGLIIQDYCFVNADVLNMQKSRILSVTIWKKDIAY